MDDSKYFQIILDIISVFDQQGQAEKSTEALLDEVLALLAACFPQAEYIRAYRLGGAYLDLWVTTEAAPPEQTRIEVQSAPAYDWALQQFAPTVEGAHWIIPLYSNRFNQGILQIGFPDEAPSDVPDWLQLAAREVSMALSNRSGRALTTLLGKATSELTDARTFREIAQVLGRHMLEGGQFLSINLNRYNPQGEFTGFEVVATANRQAAFETDERLEIGPGGFALLEEIFASSAPLIIDDVAAIDAPSSEWLGRFQIRAMCIMPLRAEGQVFGFISVNSRIGRMNLSSLRLQVYQSLADQISAMVRLHRLIEATEYTATLGERLSNTLAELSVEQDWGEMAQIIARNLVPQPGRRLGINLLERDGRGAIAAWRMLVGANREMTFPVDPYDPDAVLPWSMLPAQLRSAVEQREVVAIDNLPASVQPGDDQTIHTWFARTQIRAALIVPLIVNARPEAFLALVAREPTTFTREEINVFRSIGDQLSALLHIKSLLREAQAAHQFAVNLLEAFRAILSAEDYEAMMSAAIRVMPDFVEIASLALFDPPVSRGEVPQRILADSFVFRAAVVRRAIVDVVDPENERLRGLIDRFMSGELFIIPDLTHYVPVMSQNIIRYLKEDHAINAIGTMGLLSGSRLLGMLTFGSTSAMPTDGSQNANFRAIADQIATAIENRQLVSEAQINAQQLASQVRVLRVMTELSANIVAAEDENSLLNQSTRMLVEGLGVEHCAVILLDSAGGAGSVVSEYPPAQRTGSRYTLQNPLMRTLAERDYDLMLVYDTETDSQIDDPCRQHLLGRDIRSLLTLPLVIQGQTTGFIELSIGDPEKRFTPEMVDIAQTITSQVAIGLQNLRLLADAQRRAAQLQYIAAFSQAVQATLDLAQVFEVALKESVNVLRLDYIAIIMYDPAPGRLRLTAQRIEDQLSVDLNSGVIIPQAGTTAGKVWETRSLYHTSDLSREAHLKHPTHSDLRSLLIAPIFSRGLMLGMVEVGCFAAHVYNETDIAVFQQMVNQLGIAIENAEAYSQSQKLAQNKALVNEIATQLQQQAEMESILQVTVQELGKALGARRARVRLGTAPNGDRQ